MNDYAESALSPTLWRTCRVLANPLRLRLLRELTLCDEATVTALAARVGVTTEEASMNLRALNARGLITARRKSRWVLYQAIPNPAVRGSGLLLKAVLPLLKGGAAGRRTIIRLATALTHPRRVALVRLLAVKPSPIEDLRKAARMSRQAWIRHAKKLRDRGLIATAADGRIVLLRQAEPLGAALVRQACLEDA
jgi:DNA-binding transcriptional ArsR family regulator